MTIINKERNEDAKKIAKSRQLLDYKKNELKKKRYNEETLLHDCDAIPIFTSEKKWHL